MPRILPDGRILFIVHMKRGMNTKKAYTYAKSPAQARRNAKFNNPGYVPFRVVQDK